MNDEIEEQFINLFEIQLGYSSVYVKDIDAMFHRYSLNSCMNSNQLAKAIEITKADFHKIKEFYEQFNIKAVGTTFPQDIQEQFVSSFLNCYSTMHLNCLGILLGKGSIETKVQTLFQTFDIEAAKAISLDKLLILLNTMISVALYDIPKYCSYINNTDDSFYKYLLRLIVGKRKVLEILFDLFPKTNHEITYQEFKNTFTIKLALKLFNSKELRTYAYHIERGLERSDRTIKEYFAINNLSYSEKEIRLLKENSDREIQDLIQDQALAYKLHLKKKKKNSIIFGKLITETTVESDAPRKHSDTPCSDLSSPTHSRCNSGTREPITIDFPSIQALNESTKKGKKKLTLTGHHSQILQDSTPRSLVISPPSLNNRTFSQERQFSKIKKFKK